MKEKVIDPLRLFHRDVTSHGKDRLTGFGLKKHGGRIPVVGGVETGAAAAAGMEAVIAATIEGAVTVEAVTVESVAAMKRRAPKVRGAAVRGVMTAGPPARGRKQ